MASFFKFLFIKKNFPNSLVSNLISKRNLLTVDNADRIKELVINSLIFTEEQIMKTTLALFFFAISIPVFAQTPIGTFEKISGPEECPEGYMQILDIEKEERILMFGARDSWALKKENKGEVQESSEDGCEFITRYTIAPEKYEFEMETVKCKETKFNSKGKSVFTFNKNKLTYEYQTDSKIVKKSKYACQYTKKSDK